MDIFSDGGSRGNPGPAACAFVVIDGGEIVHREAKYLGKTTNNIAEYSGVILALSWLYQTLVTDHRSPTTGERSPITFYMDSELVVNQLNGKYKVRDQKLKNFFLIIQSLIKKIPQKILFKNVPRNQNRLADFLLNKKLDEIKIGFTSPRKN